MSALHDRIMEICSESVSSTPFAFEADAPSGPGPSLDSGHSGATLRLAVVKFGETEATHREVGYARLLGSGVCPQIFGAWPGGYAMEQLTPHTHSESLLNAREVLRVLVWSRPPEWSRDDASWVTEFILRFDAHPPEWVVGEQQVLIHGDPTYGNITLGPTGGTKLLDPKPPGSGIPSYRSVDLGKMLQSMLGWEQFITGRRSPALLSPLWDLTDVELTRAVFWCQVHLRRIMQRQTKGDRVWTWAHERRNLLIKEVLP